MPGSWFPARYFSPTKPFSPYYDGNALVPMLSGSRRLLRGQWRGRDPLSHLTPDEPDSMPI